jgi:hypothetical protein
LTEAVYIIYRNYLRNDHFVIHSSFAGSIKNALLQIFYNYRQKFRDTVMSLDNEINNSKSNNNKEFSDIVYSFGGRKINEGDLDAEESLFKKDRTFIVEMINLIKYIIENLKFEYNEKTALFVLKGLRYKFECRKNNFLSEYYDYVGSDISKIIEDSFSLIKKDLQENAL